MTTLRGWLRSRRALLLLPLAPLALGMGCLSTRGAALPESAPAPEFALQSHLGRTVKLSELVERGPAVVIFYRGHW